MHNCGVCQARVTTEELVEHRRRHLAEASIVVGQFARMLADANRKLPLPLGDVGCTFTVWRGGVSGDEELACINTHPRAQPVWQGPGIKLSDGGVLCGIRIVPHITEAGGVPSACNHQVMQTGCDWCLKTVRAMTREQRRGAMALLQSLEPATSTASELAEADHQEALCERLSAKVAEQEEELKSVRMLLSQADASGDKFVTRIRQLEEHISMESKASERYIAELKGYAAERIAWDERARQAGEALGTLEVNLRTLARKAEAAAEKATPK